MPPKRFGYELQSKPSIAKGQTLREAKEITNARRLMELRLGVTSQHHRIKPFDFGDLKTYVPTNKGGRPRVNPIKTPFEKEAWLVKLREGIRRREENRTAAKQMMDKAEHMLVAEAIEKLPREFTEGRVQVLAKKMDEEMKQRIRAARRKLVLNAERYVEVHIQATEKALQSEDFSAAAKNAEWALESIGEGTERVIERAKAIAAPDTQSKVMIGINLGGVPKADQPKAIEAIRVKAEE